jgi:hypothetical protein
MIDLSPEAKMKLEGSKALLKQTEDMEAYAKQNKDAHERQFRHYKRLHNKTVKQRRALQKSIASFPQRFRQKAYRDQKKWFERLETILP